MGRPSIEKENTGIGRSRKKFALFSAATAAIALLTIAALHTSPPSPPLKCLANLVPKRIQGRDFRATYSLTPGRIGGEDLVAIEHFYLWNGDSKALLAKASDEIKAQGARVLYGPSYRKSPNPNLPSAYLLLAKYPSGATIHLLVNSYENHPDKNELSVWESHPTTVAERFQSWMRRTLHVQFDLISKGERIHWVDRR